MQNKIMPPFNPTPYIIAKKGTVITATSANKNEITRNYPSLKKLRNTTNIVLSYVNQLNVFSEPVIGK